MSQLLYAVKLFGRELTWSVSTTVLLLMAIQIALILVALIIFGILMARKVFADKNKQSILVTQAPTVRKSRTLVGITLDTAVVQRDFRVGDEFNCEGLIVMADYSSEPMTEVITDYTVYAPAMNEEGKPTVTVTYRDFTAAYAISITADASYVPEKTLEEPEKGRVLTGITLDTLIVQREFFVGDEFNYDGLVVTASYSEEPLTEAVTDYIVEAPNMAEQGKPTVTVKYGDVSAYYTISVSEREEPVAEPKERILLGITLDTFIVQREFTVGDKFNCDGLVVTASYSEEPYYETVDDYTVEIPPMDCEGKPSVIVKYGDATGKYTISVNAPVVQIEEPVVEEIKERKLVSIELDTTNVKTEFTDRESFSSHGLLVIAHYDGEPESEYVTDYVIDIPDLSKEGKEDVVVHYNEFSASYPVFVTRGRCLVGISLDTGVVQREFQVGEEFNCIGLMVSANYDAAPFTEQISDYEVAAPDMSTEGKPVVTVSYMGKSAVYTVSISQAEPEEVAATSKHSIVIDEESVEAKILRYDRSFTARLIQSNDETKQWYTILKNDLLSYKKVKDRMSWKRETYRFGREAVAKFGFRGKMLCLFLSVDPNEYVDSKYKLEDVSDNRSFEDTPSMYRIKNSRRVKFAMELIAVIMERVGAKRYDRISEDYYMPYEGVVELINKGLIKRNMKSGADEAIFLTHGDNDKTVVSVRPVEEIRQQEQVATVIEAPVEDAPVEEAPVEEASAEEAPVEEATVEEAPVEEASAEEAPIEEAPVEEAPIEEAPVEEATVEEAPVEEVPVEEAPVEEVPVEEVPVEEAPVEEAPVEEKVSPVDELDAEFETEGEVVYDFSYRAKLIQSSSEVKIWYSKLKNELLSYMNIQNRTVWKNEFFKLEKHRLAKFGFKGKELCLFLRLDPKDYVSEYDIDDVTESLHYGETPLMYCISDEEHFRRAFELIDKTMEQAQAKRMPHYYEEFSEPYKSTEELVESGLIKKQIVSE